MRTRMIALTAACALALTACGLNPFGGNGTITVTATFDDVIDLVRDHSVRYNDLTVGSVQEIDLTENHQARVTMAIDGSEHVPSEVRAEIAKTSVLGERYVALVPTSEDPACCLEDGRTIEATSVRTDLEDLIRSGSDLLVGVSADAVATTIETGAEAFGGNADLIGGFIDDVNALVSTFDDNSDDLLALIDALDRVTAAYAENAPQNAAVLADLREAAAALQDQDDQLLDTLDDATALATEASGFLSVHQDEIRNFTRRLRKVLQQVEEANGDVEQLLAVGPTYLENLRLGAYDLRTAEREAEAQVFLDIIMCGLQDDQDDPSQDCTPGTEGR